MATFYFNNAVDSFRDTLGNWWNDSACTDPALALPTSSDDIVVLASFSGTYGETPMDEFANITLDPAGVISSSVDVTNTFSASGGSLGDGYTITCNNAILSGTFDILGTIQATQNITVSDSVSMADGSANLFAGGKVIISGCYFTLGTISNGGTLTPSAGLQLEISGGAFGGINVCASKITISSNGSVLAAKIYDDLNFPAIVEIYLRDNSSFLCNISDIHATLMQIDNKTNGNFPYYVSKVSRSSDILGTGLL